jgi:phosphoglucomutase
LFWLNILAVRCQPATAILADHWRRYGRHFYSRHDYEAVDAGRAARLIELLRERLAALPGEIFGGFAVERADEFAYTDPVDGTISARQGIRIECAGGARIVYRLSGTGTEGATLRVYLERFEPEIARHGIATDAALEPLAITAATLADIPGLLGRTRPNVVA